jgi:hypothetical protein
LKRQSIRQHLRPYSIRERRATTIHHAFASALAVSEEYDDARISQALRDLGQDPDQELVCCYCGHQADTWDHVFGLVKGKEYAGYGHTVGNLIPCCKNCNSAKGNKNWRTFLATVLRDEQARAMRVRQLEQYFEWYLGSAFGPSKIDEVCPAELKALNDLRGEILALMKKADDVAFAIRKKIAAHLSSDAIVITAQEAVNE